MLFAAIFFGAQKLTPVFMIAPIKIEKKQGYTFNRESQVHLLEQRILIQCDVLFVQPLRLNQICCQSNTNTCGKLFCLMK